MYHYVTTVYRLGVREDVVHLWRDYIPQQALEHPFLMHGLLALAALHLAYLRTDHSLKYLQAGDRHQDVALQKFRSFLSSPSDPKLADALFALAATLSVSSMARSCAEPDGVALDMDTIAELFILTRGVKNVLHLAFDHIKNGPLAALLKNQSHSEYIEVHLPSSVASCFEGIQHMLTTSGMDQEALQHCESALSELEKIYKRIAFISPTADIELGDVSRWQVVVSMEYVRLVQARRPMALIILAYYVAAITAVRTAWYTQRWAQCALHGISQELDASMHNCIRWPMEQIHSRLAELGVRSPDSHSVAQSQSW